MYGSVNSNQSGVVKITLEGNAQAVSDILSGNTVSAIEQKLLAQQEAIEACSEVGEMQIKMWKAEEEAAAAKNKETRARLDLERSNRLVREHEQTIAALAAENERLRAEVTTPATNAVGLTEEQYAQLGAERENVFQNLMAGVAFPDHKPKPTTLAELFSFFVFPIFEAGSESAGQWRRGCVNKIAMIKQLREQTGAGLKEAKNFIDGAAAELK
jgi:hypothetical protein